MGYPSAQVSLAHIYALSQLAAYFCRKFGQVRIWSYKTDIEPQCNPSSPELCFRTHLLYDLGFLLGSCIILHCSIMNFYQMSPLIHELARMAQSASAAILTTLPTHTLTDQELV